LSASSRASHPEKRKVVAISSFSNILRNIWFNTPACFSYGLSLYPSSWNCSIQGHMRCVIT
jgi:hypothetical protein